MAFRPFFMQVAYKPYQQAFFIAVSEFAQMSAKGLPASYWDIALAEGCSIAGVPQDNAGLQDLIKIFQDNCEVPVVFLKNGKRVEAVVRWDRNEMFPTCN